MLQVGDICYFIDFTNHKKVTTGVIQKETPSQFSINIGSGIKRKKKNNVFKDEAKLKADIVRKANYWLQQEYGVNIPEVYTMFVEAFEKYPEKFV